MLKTGIEKLLLCIAAITNRDVQKSLIVAEAAKKATKEYLNNRDHYNDMIQFNVCNGIKSDKTYHRVTYTDLPPDIREHVRSLYDRFSGKSTNEIFLKLGISPTSGNKYSPIEAKWAYMYIKKFGWDYNPRNKLKNREILRPLNSNEYSEYLSMF
jgi:hypothetical protein